MYEITAETWSLQSAQVERVSSRCSVCQYTLSSSCRGPAADIHSMLQLGLWHHVETQSQGKKLEGLFASLDKSSLKFRFSFTILRLNVCHLSE